MSHGSTAASTSRRMGGRQAPVCHMAPLRELATRALPAAQQTECGTSLCLDGPISRLRAWWTTLLETTAHRAAGSGCHPLRRAASAIYELQAFVVMANHVHLLVLPRVSPSRFLQTIKGYTHAKLIGYSDARASHSGRRNPTIIRCAPIGKRTKSRRILRIIP